MERISIDEFKKVAIAVGEIIDAEVVPDADKLLRLTVNFAEETPRQIVSGIRAYIPDPAVLRGVKCAFAINLEPKTIRGLESNGMILGAHTEEGAFSLLRIDQTIPAGTRVI